MRNINNCQELAELQLVAPCKAQKIGRYLFVDNALTTNIPISKKGAVAVVQFENKREIKKLIRCLKTMLKEENNENKD